MSVRILVSIINWNNPKATLNCAKSIYSNHNIDVLIVDSGSIEGSIKELEIKCSNFTLLKLNENKGFVGAANSIFKLNDLSKDYDYVVLSNNDLVFKSDTIDALIECMELSSNIGVLSPEIFNPQTNQYQLSGSNFDFFRSGSYRRNSTSVIHKKIPGACMMIRTNILERVGLMNQNFYLYYGDREWQERVLEAGWDINVLNDTHVTHFGGRTIGNKSSIYYYYFTIDFLEYIKLKYGYIGLTYSVPNSFFRRMMSIIILKNSKKMKLIKYLILAYIDFFLRIKRQPLWVGEM